jgi:glycerol-3-phosphate acyltransferase PlsX
LIKPTHIAVDGMGGDFGPRVVVPAIAEALRRHSDLFIHLVGHKGQLGQVISEQKQQLDYTRLKIIHVQNSIAMSDSPAAALRSSLETSMRTSLTLLSENSVSAVVSAGNTGVLMALSRQLVGMCKGIRRPAICSAIPSRNAKNSYLMDLGANTDCTPFQLYQFAQMGIALVKALEEEVMPRVALLNIGTEGNKGNELVKAAAKIIASDAKLNYVGFIEGTEIHNGAAEVIVSDGFSGNIALKVSEGTANYIGEQIKQVFQKGLVSRIAGFIAIPFLKQLWRDIDPRGYNGAFFLGLEGIVVKSHGNSTAFGFLAAIEEAKRSVDKNMISLIKQELDS